MPPVLSSLCGLKIARGYGECHPFLAIPAFRTDKTEIFRKVVHRMQSTGPHRFEMDDWISRAPFERLLHMEIVEAAEGRATLTMPFLVDFAQGAGLMHGGALVSLADTAVAMAIKSVLPPQTPFATVSMESRFLRPVTQGVVTARAKICEQTGRTLQGQATVCDQDGNSVLDFSCTFRIAEDRAIRGMEWGEF
jgi:uncharacterized protein (TIGR00369 family)